MSSGIPVGIFSRRRRILREDRVLEAGLLERPSASPRCPARTYGRHFAGVAGIEVVDDRLHRLDELAARVRRGILRLEPPATDERLRRGLLLVEAVVHALDA